MKKLVIKIIKCKCGRKLIAAANVIVKRGHELTCYTCWKKKKK